MSKRAPADSHTDLAKKKVRLASEETSKTDDQTYTHKIKSNNSKADIGLSDVLSLEHAVNNLQNSLKTVLEKALDSKELEAYKEQVLKTDDSNPEIVLALVRSKLKLAAHLKTLYQLDQLPIFDQIIDFEKLTEEITTSDKVEIDIGKELTRHANDDEPVKRREDGIPELPEIENPAIKARVFIHKSLVKDKLFISDSEVIHAHNERLEFIGDSVLNNIMSLIIYNSSPNASEGEMSQLRARLISNVNLQRWAHLYGFQNDLKMNTDDSIFKGKLKIYADVFEAYVGGLITENPANYSKIYKWLKALAEPLLEGKEDFDADGKTIKPSTGEKKSVDSREKELNTNAKVQLYSLIGYAGLGLHYDTVKRVVNKEITQFTVQVKTIDDEVLGTGVGKNTKEAGYRAAMDALENKPILEKFSQKRASIPRGESKQSLGSKPTAKARSSEGTEQVEWVRDSEGKWVKSSPKAETSAPFKRAKR